MNNEDDVYYEEDLYNNVNTLSDNYGELDLIKDGDVFVDEDGKEKLRLYFDENYNFTSKSNAAHETVINLRNESSELPQVNDTIQNGEKYNLHDDVSFSYVDKDNRTVETIGYYEEIPNYDEIKKAGLELKNLISNKNK